MPMFYIHAFHKERVKYEIEAESREAAAELFDDIISGKAGCEIEREPTDEFCDYYLVDPALEDGSVDYENAKWYPEYEVE